MNKKSKPRIRTFFTVLLIIGILPFSTPAFAENQTIDRWLLLGPAPIPAVEANLLGNHLDMLNFKYFDMSKLEPAAKKRVRWDNTRTLTWGEMKVPDFKGYETGVFFLATYLEPSRFMKTGLTIYNSNMGVTVYLDGKVVKAKVNKDKIKAPLVLTNQKHLLVLKILLVKNESFKFKATLTHSGNFRNEQVAVSISPKRKLTPRHILNSTRLSRIRLSPDGRHVAVSLNRTDEKSGKPVSWVEVLNANNGKTLFSSRYFGRVSNFRWIGGSSAFSFTRAAKGKTSIFRYNLGNNQVTPLKTGIDKFSSYWWTANGSFFIYSTYTEPDESPHYKYITDMGRKSGNSGHKYSMYIYFPGGSTHQLSDEEQNFSGASISPNSKKVLFTRFAPENNARPFEKRLFFMLDLDKMAVEPVLESLWINSASWSYDSKKLLFIGGPSSFKGIGNVLDKEIIPNDFDYQLYIYDLASKKADAVSKSFKPSLNQASWLASKSNIYIRATDKADIGLFRYSVKKKKYTRYKTPGVDVVRRATFAAKQRTAVYWGSAANVPYKLYRIDLSSGKSKVIKDFNRQLFRNAAIGKVKNWNFKTVKGKTITGRLHFPPDFSPQKKYPCIVYYYGGTSPVTRDFGGRYPKNWYAANGYIVYVLQPSGAVGFGQEFASVHVNDWGKITATEVIEGVKQLTKAHPYIDPKRIGAMGASYGGFLTQYIATQTDTITAYISHAGIASLSSYWGVGDWGYTYSGIATAKSYPWNRKDIYVGHSPLFMAERIKNPLLLLHGDIDNNVPPGESFQMFTALKILKKDVELITFKNQRHWIQEYKKRLQWMKTIIAWWDKHLKDQPEHWQEMYKKD